MNMEAAFAETGYDPEIEELLDRSSLPSMLLGDDSSTILTGQTRSELFDEEYMPHTCLEEDWTVNTREFLEGLLGSGQSQKVETGSTETGYNTMMEQLIDRSSLPSIFLDEETNATFEEENSIEPCSESLSLHSTFEDNSKEVNSQEFTKGLMSSSESQLIGGRTSSRKSLSSSFECKEANTESYYAPEMDKMLDTNSQLSGHESDGDSFEKELLLKIKNDHSDSDVF